MLTRVLLINCHPAFGDQQHVTNQLANYSLSLLSTIPNVQVDVLNLYDENTVIPQLNESMLHMWDKTHEQRSAFEQELSHRQNQLIQQWIAADAVLIYSPLYNFNITSKLKDYLDNILITGQTFDFTESGLTVGLLNDDKKVAYIQSSSWRYDENFSLVNSDIAPHYMRTALNFMGIQYMKLIRAQGIDSEPMDSESKMALVKEEIRQYITHYIGEQ